MNETDEIDAMFKEFAEYYQYSQAEVPTPKTNGDKDLETEDTRTAWLQLWAGRYK